MSHMGVGERQSEKNMKERYATRFRVPDPPQHVENKGPHPFLRRSFIPRPISAGPRLETCQNVHNDAKSLERLEIPKIKRPVTQPCPCPRENSCLYFFAKILKIRKCTMYWNMLVASREKISKLEKNCKTIMASNQEHVSHNNQMKETLAEAVSELAIIRKDIKFKVEPTISAMELKKNVMDEIEDHFNQGDFPSETFITRDQTDKVGRFIHEMSRIEKDWLGVVKNFEVLDEQMVSVGAIQRHLISLAEFMTPCDTDDTCDHKTNIDLGALMSQKESQDGGEDEDSFSDDEDFFNREFQTSESDFEIFRDNRGRFTSEEDIKNLINKC